MMTTLRVEIMILPCRVPGTRRAGASQVLVDDLLEVFFRCQADDRLDDLTALEEQDGRDAPDLEFDGRIRVVVDVQLSDRDLSGVVGRQRVDGGRQPLAGSAPLGPEIDQYGL